MKVSDTPITDDITQRISEKIHRNAKGIDAHIITGIFSGVQLAIYTLEQDKNELSTIQKQGAQLFKKTTEMILNAANLQVSIAESFQEESQDGHSISVDEMNDILLSFLKVKAGCDITLAYILRVYKINHPVSELPDLFKELLSLDMLSQ